MAKFPRLRLYDGRPKEYATVSRPPIDLGERTVYGMSMSLVCERIMGAFITRLDSLGVPFSSGPLYDEAVSSVEKLLVKNELKGLSDASVDAGNGEGFWKGTWGRVDGEGDHEPASFLQWPPGNPGDGWFVRMEFRTEEEAQNLRLLPVLEDGGWLVTLRTFYNGVLQDPPDQQPAVTSWVVTAEKRVFKREEIHFSGGKMWNPEKGRPAMAQYNKDEMVVFSRDYKDGKVIGVTLPIDEKPSLSRAKVRYGTRSTEDGKEIGR